jgi:hypothetical protein
MPMLRRLALTTLCAAACGTATPPAGDGDDASDGGDTSTGEPPAGSTGDTGEDDPTTDAAPLPDPFEPDRANIQLLPFRVRFNKLQQLVDLPPEDPAFDVLRARRYELGDYDYAAGISPDLTWTSSKISVWIAAMLPVCRSPAMHAKFPTFPDALEDLLAEAYGVVPAPEQLADYENLLGDATLDDAARYDTVCAAALTALEFVAQ